MKIGSDAATLPTAVELTGKDTALLTFSAKNQSTDAKLTVKNVKTDKNVVIETVEKDVRFIDVVAPMTGSVEVIAPRVIRVNFSEPLASKPEFKLNNGQTAIVSTDFTVGNDYADLTIGIDPANGSSHTLEVVGGADYAGFKIDSVTKTFVYQTDVVAPMATISKVLDNNSVEIKFDKELNASTLTDNLEIYHTVKGGNGYKATAVTSVKSGTKDTIVVDFPGAVFPEGQVKFFLGYKDDKGTLLQDKWGNKFAATELSAVYAADKEVPTLVSVEGKTKRTIELKLSEEVSADSVVKAGNIVLTDADNKVVAVNATLSDDKKVVTLTSTSDLAGGNYKVVAKDIADASGNKLAEVARTFYVNDMVAPTVNASADLLAEGKKVKIKFSEAMNAASITDKSKYKLVTADLDSKVTITAVDGNKAVILDFSATTETLAGKKITVGRVADATGNLTTDFSSEVTVSGTQSTVAAKEAQVTGKNTVKVYFDEVITGAVAGDFVVSNDESTALVTNVVNSIEAGKSVLTLTVNQDLPFNAEKVTVSTAAEVKAKNNDGLFVKFPALDAKDKFAPEISGAVFADNMSTDGTDTLTVTFTEGLYAPSVQDSDFTVAGRVVEAIEVGTNTVTLKLKADGTNASAKPASVSIVNTIEDTARNAKSSQVFTIPAL
ncbi:Ig-like domain-containing protein [Exiguobacterium artemiae]